MDTSHLLARIFGIMLIVLYGGILINQRFYGHIWKDIAHHPISLLLSGFINLLLGLLVIQVHHIWTADWRGLITLLGWLLIVSGVFRILFPESVLRLWKKCFEHSPTFVNVAAAIMLLIGLYLTYVGFISPLS